MIQAHSRAFSPPLPGLREGCFAAFGAPDEHLGTERLILVTEVRAPLAESLKHLTATISRKCFLELGIAPDDIIFVPSGTLAKASSGKRRHRYFRKMYMTGGLERYRISPIDLMLASAAEESPDRPVEQVS